MTVDYSVQLDSALEALLFRIFGINGLDAGEQMAELEARSLALFFRTPIRYPKRRIGISEHSNRPRDVRRSRRLLCRRHRAGFTLGLRGPNIIRRNRRRNR